MMFYKLLISFLMAFVAASCVAASATPVARSNYDYPPPLPDPTPTSQCDPADTYCCNTWTTSQNPVLGVTDIGVLFYHLDPNLIDGLDCTSTFDNGNW